MDLPKRLCSREIPFSKTSLEVVYCVILIDDGEYILSFAIGERYIAVWRIDGSEK